MCARLVGGICQYPHRDSLVLVDVEDGMVEYMDVWMDNRIEWWLIDRLYDWFRSGYGG